MTIPSNGSETTLTHLNQEYDHLYEYRVTDTGLKRAGWWLHKVFWLLDLIGLRTCSDVFMKVIGHRINNQEEIRGLTQNFVVLGSKQLKDVQTVFQRCVKTRDIDKDVRSELEEGVKQAAFLRLKQEVEGIHERDIVLAEGDVLDYFKAYYEQGGKYHYSDEEIVTTFKRDIHRQDWHLGKNQESIEQEAVTATLEQWQKEDPELYTNIQNFCQQAIGGTMVCGDFKDRKAKKAAIWHRYSDLEKKLGTKNKVHVVPDQRVRVFKDQKRLVYESDFNCKVRAQGSDIKVSCTTSVEWDMENRQLIFRPGYNFKVHEGCTLEDLETLKPLLFRD